MAKKGNASVQIYEGTPRDIIVKLAREMADAFGNAGIPMTGVHVIALMHLLCSAAVTAEASDGKMPSFRTLLQVLTHGITRTDWSQEELESFGEEFCSIVESLGGGKVEHGKPYPAPPWMGPTTTLVH